MASSPLHFPNLGCRHARKQAWWRLGRLGLWLLLVATRDPQSSPSRSQEMGSCSGGSWWEAPGVGSPLPGSGLGQVCGPNRCPKQAAWLPAAVKE